MLSREQSHTRDLSRRMRQDRLLGRAILRTRYAAKEPSAGAIALGFALAAVPPGIQVLEWADRNGNVHKKSVPLPALPARWLGLPKEWR